MIDGTSEIDRIERELAATRAQLDGTLAALQQKLSPGELVSQAAIYFKEGSGMDLSHNLGRSLRDNPVPVALIGLGLGWLVVSGSRRPKPARGTGYRVKPDQSRREFRDDAYRHAVPGREPETSAHRSLPYQSFPQQSGPPGDYQARLRAASTLRREEGEDEGSFQDRLTTAKGAIVGVTRDLGEAAAAFRERVEQAIAAGSDGIRRAGREALAFAGEAGTSAGEVAGSVVARGEAGLRTAYDYGRSAAYGVRDGADEAVHRAQDLGGRATAYLQEQPLLLGAIGVTVGAALGMLLPSSRYEREMLGEVREGLRDSAAEAVRDVRDRAVRVAGSVVESGQEAVRREGLADLGPAELAASAREQLGDTASRVRAAVEKTAVSGRQTLERELAPSNAGSDANGPGARAGEHDRPRFAS